MKIIAGLGNPGPKYETTRHNVGFLAVDRLIDDWRASGPDEAYQSIIHQATVAGEKVLLVKPETFMNLSGESIAPMMKFYKCTPDDLIVIHDDLDLKPMALRVKTGGGTGGHNGLKSIDQSLGSTEYHRIRMGIGHPSKLVHPSAQGKHARVVADYVLQNFTDEELQDLDPLLDRVTKIAELIIRGEIRQAMTEYNREQA
jgi:PTH1 family peptidyl-tRNA hydrolase